MSTHKEISLTNAKNLLQNIFHEKSVKRLAREILL
jgi:hypothetical protein